MRRVLCAWVLAACGSPAVPMVDAGADAGSPLVVAAPMPPAEAAPPSWACPAGWRSVEVVPGVTACDPWPSTGRATCAIDEAHFPGGTGCERIGPACPADGWPADLPSGAAVIYVVASAAPGGDGSLARPFQTLREGLAAASAGSIVALGAGRYDGGLVTVPVGVEVRGACTADTVVSGDLIANAGLVQLGGVLRSLRIDAHAIAVDITADGVAELHDVVISRAWQAGIRSLFGGSLRGDHVSIRSVEVDADGITGVGLAASANTLELDQLAVDGTVGAAIWVDGGNGDAPHVTLHDAVIGRVAPSPIDGGSIGVWDRIDGAVVDLERVVIEGLQLGMEIDLNAVLNASDVVLHDFDPSAGELAGMLCSTSSHCELDRVLISDPPALGVDLDGGFLTARDFVIAHPHPRAGSTIAMALHVRDQGQLDLQRAALVDARAIALFAHDDGTIVRLGDVRITGTTMDEPTSDYGGALVSSTQASITGERVLLDDNAGLSAVAYLASLDLSDLVVRDTRELARMDPIEPRASGVALFSFGGQLYVQRAALARARGFAVEIRDGSQLELTDVLVSDVRSLARGDRGEGIYLDCEDPTQPISAMLTRVRVEGAAEIGLLAGRSATVRGQDVAVIDTRRSTCPADVCADGHPGGSNLMVHGAGRLELTRFVSQGAELAGLHLGEQPQIALADGEIDDNAYGLAALQQPDLAGIAATVRFERNAQPFLGAGAFVPAAPAGIDLGAP